MAEPGEIELRRCPKCGGLAGYAPEELARIPTSAIYGACSCPQALSPRATLDALVTDLVDAVRYDARDFFGPDGSFRPVRTIPRQLMLLVKGVKIKRLMPEEWADLLGVPAADVVELQWASQASLTMETIKLLAALMAQQRDREPLTDEEVEAGALQFLASRFPDLVEKHPEVFAGALAKEKKP